MKPSKLLMMILIFEISSSIIRSCRRKFNYKLALQQKKKSGKRLLVIGDPNNGGWSSVIGKEYDCGDVCTDLVGCKQCPNQIQGNLLDVLKSFPDNSVVIFESCVLEYLPKLNEVKNLWNIRFKNLKIFNKPPCLTTIHRIYR